MWFLLEGGYANTEKSNKKTTPKKEILKKKKDACMIILIKSDNCDLYRQPDFLPPLKSFWSISKYSSAFLAHLLRGY